MAMSMLNHQHRVLWSCGYSRPRQCTRIHVRCTGTAVYLCDKGLSKTFNGRYGHSLEDSDHAGVSKLHVQREHCLLGLFLTCLFF